MSITLQGILMFYSSLSHVYQWTEKPNYFTKEHVVSAFFFIVGKLHRDDPIMDHPGNLTIVLSFHLTSNSL